jgi:hypothetical protein
LPTFVSCGILRSVVEEDYSYKVVRMKEKKDNKYQVEAITVYKRPFDEWFIKEAEMVRVEILESQLKKSIQTKYPNVWWTRTLSP